MQQTILTEYLTLQHCVARIIRQNPIYQLNGKYDDHLIGEVRREWNMDAKADSILRTARKIRRLIKNA